MPLVVPAGHWFNALAQDGKIVGVAVELPPTTTVPGLKTVGQSCMSNTAVDFVIAGVVTLPTDPT